MSESVSTAAANDSAPTSPSEPIKSVPSVAPVDNEQGKDGDSEPGFQRRKSDIGVSERPSQDHLQVNGDQRRPMTAYERVRKSLFSDEQRSLLSRRSIPSIVVDDASSRPSSRWSERKWGGLRSRKSTESVRARTSPAPQAEKPFQGITLEIPKGDLEELAMSSMDFSNADGASGDKQSLRSAPTTCETPTRTQTPLPRKRMSNSPKVRQSTVSSKRVISADEDLLSRRVRLMYEKGDENVTEEELNRAIAEENGVLWEEPASAEEGQDQPTESNPPATDAKSVRSAGGNTIRRQEHELGGGIEDWKDVEAGDVDRYGFIVPRSSKEGQDGEPHPLQRVSTSLLIASETPRRKLSLIRSQSAQRSTRSITSRSSIRGRKMSESSMRPTSSQSAYSPSLSRSPSRFRYAANRLPHNRDRRLREEAGDMLTLPFEVPNSFEDSPANLALKRKEWEREEKWRKMAKPTKKANDGSGMTFEFDTTSSKLIERTWKGIPDSWRSAAWYAFLEASAKKRKGSPTAQELIQAFHDFQNMSSPDDVQIDIDVPRTVSSHIMFRRRYRGGQRLLFRVLHAMSLYFPETGYVQGMAALAATLLSYYDEEHAFVMLARLWMLRGLEHLYRSGFSGLMEALEDFEREWLGNGEVAAKLVCSLL